MSRSLLPASTTKLEQTFDLSVARLLKLMTTQLSNPQQNKEF